MQCTVDCTCALLIDVSFTFLLVRASKHPARQGVTRLLNSSTICNNVWHHDRPSPPETPDFGAINTTLSYAATQPAAAGAAQSSTSTTQQQQQWQGAWQAPQQQLRRAGSSGGSLNAAASSSGSLLDAAAAHSQPVRIPEARVLPYR